MPSSKEITLKNVRLAFPELFVPSAYNESAPKQYSATFLIEKDSDNYNNVVAAMKEAAKDKWGGKADAIYKSVENNTQKCCFIDGANKAHLDGYEGNFALTAKNKKRPTVVDIDATPLTDVDNKPYAGCYVNAKVEIWTQDNQHGKAIRASLLGVQFFKDGDAFAAGRVANPDEFEDLSNTGEDSIDDLA